MRRFFANVLNGIGLIVGDAIEEWATKVTRDELVATIRKQQEKIDGLEADLDAAAQDFFELQNRLTETEEQYRRLAEAPKPPDPFEPVKAKYCGYCGDPVDGGMCVSQICNVISTPVQTCIACHEPEHVGPCPRPDYDPYRCSTCGFITQCCTCPF